MSGKIGLVLSGGGAKGAYEIGVYKALSEIRADYYIDSIAGTSVGALNAVLMESCGAEYSEQIWRNLKITDMLNPNINNLTKFIPAISSVNKPPQLSMDTMKNNNIFDDSIFDFQEAPF
ncbi:MAG: patatin-like phospholipase family protein, partial [Ruminococcus sp.]|nr:patatin-like phospholipase family protein [Ruminococcus sp.]